MFRIRYECLLVGKLHVIRETGLVRIELNWKIAGLQVPAPNPAVSKILADSILFRLRSWSGRNITLAGLALKFSTNFKALNI